MIPEDQDQLPAQFGLFHKSSLRQRIDPPLQIHAIQTYQYKKTINQNGSQMINQYQIINNLGRGAFGEVLLVRSQGKQFALKVCSTWGLQKQRFFAADGQFANSLDVLNNELNIVKRLKHQNLAVCKQIIYGHDKICSVLQLGDLGQIMIWSQLQDKYIRNNKIQEYLRMKYKLNNIEDVTRLIFIQICQAVLYLHKNDISNRDIKVDNMLCRTTQQSGNQILLVDFTTVRYGNGDDISYFPTGTPGFRGPEHQFAFEEGYSCKATDVFAVGVAMWTYLHQKLPFPGQQDLQRDISSKNIELQFREDCPQVLVNFVKKTTCKDWKKRINIQQALLILKQSS